MKTGGIGASLSAVIHESLFNDLDHEVGENIQPASRLASQRAGSQPASPWAGTRPDTAGTRSASSGAQCQSS